MEKLALFTGAFIVCVPVIIGLSTDEILPSLAALAWAAAWWFFFRRTKVGRKAYRKGYRIASHLMQDC